VSLIAVGPRPETEALRPVQACAGRLGAAGLSPPCRGQRQWPGGAGSTAFPASDRLVHADEAI